MQSPIFIVDNQYTLVDENNLSDESDHVRIPQKLLQTPMDFGLQFSFTCSFLQPDTSLSSSLISHCSLLSFIPQQCPQAWSISNKMPESLWFHLVFPLCLNCAFCSSSPRNLLSYFLLEVIFFGTLLLIPFTDPRLSEVVLRWASIVQEKTLFVRILKDHCEPVVSMWLALHGSLLLWGCILIICSFLIIPMINSIASVEL